MVKQVTVCLTCLRTDIFQCFHNFTESGVDYIGVEDTVLIFGVGDHRVCHNVQIFNDSLCELSPTEYFFSSLEHERGEMPVFLNPDRARIIINDASECGKYTNKLYQSVGRRSM